MYKVEKFKTKNYAVVNGDCLDYLSQIPDNSIDLILTDPPYNIAQYSTGNIDLPGRTALNNDLAEWDLEPIEPAKLLADFKEFSSLPVIFLFLRVITLWENGMQLLIVSLIHFNFLFGIKRTLLRRYIKTDF